MSRVPIPNVSRTDGLWLRRISLLDETKGSLIAGEEDPTTWLWAAGGTVPKADLDRLVKRDLIWLLDHIEAEMATAPPSRAVSEARQSWRGRLWRVGLTARGRATLVVFDATTDVTGRRPKSWKVAERGRA